MDHKLSLESRPRALKPDRWARQSRSRTAARATVNQNVEVLNDTADLYRYLDCTGVAEFLYECVTRTVEQDLPKEINDLRRHDEAIQRIMNAVEMPDRLAENLVRYIRSNHGKLSRRRQEGEFSRLTEAEGALLEGIVNDAFEGCERGPEHGGVGADDA